MRPLEIALVACLLAVPLSLVPRRWRGRRLPAVLAVAAAGLAFLQPVIEGYRWSMVPLDALAAVWLLVAVAAWWWRRAPSRTRTDDSGRRLRLLGAIGGSAAVALVAAPAYLFPVFTLPGPTGSERAGVTWDVFTPAPPPGEQLPPWHRAREISLHITYPSAADGETLPYMAPAAARATALAWNAPPFVLQHFTLVHTHSHAGAPVAASGGPRPVVLLSLSGLMTACTALAEDLATHGYVVVSVGHRDPRWTPFVFDRQGSVVPLDPDDQRSRALAAELESPAVESVKERILGSTGATDKASLARTLVEVQPLNTADVRLCAFEASATLDRLRELNAGGGPLAGRLDLDLVAIVGFSKGGAVAGQACLADPRFRAGVNMDGFMYGDIAESPVERPFLFMHSENPEHPLALINGLFFERSTGDSVMIHVRGSRHGNFGDPSLWNLQRRGPGPIDGERMIEILRAYVRAFLDMHLSGIPSPLLRGPSSEYPEVRVWTRELGTG